MNNDLFLKMSKDMNINRYIDEPQKQFEIRVLYSAIILWLKTICLDENVGSDEYYGVSKNYFHRRANFILNHIMSFFPKFKNWAELGSDECDVINFLRERLIKTGNIIEDGNRVLLSLQEDLAISESMSQKFGIEYGTLDYTLGVSIVKKTKNESYYSDSSDNLNLFEDYFNNIKFNIDNSDYQKEYFDPYIKTDTFYKSWSENKPNCDMYISRINSEYGQVIYFVEKYNNGNIHTHRINDFIITTGFLKKLLLFLRYQYKNPIYVNITKHTDYFTLTRHIKDFAGLEEKFIQSFGWPINNLVDELNWCFSIDVYNDVIKILNNLLIKIKEV